MRKFKVGGQEVLVNVFLNPPTEADNDPEIPATEYIFSEEDILPDDDLDLDGEEGVHDICEVVGSLGRRLCR